jgi:hypothetical protein
MLTADEIRRRLSCLPDPIALKVRDELSQHRVYEAERLACVVLGNEAAEGLIASIVRDRMRADWS